MSKPAPFPEFAPMSTTPANAIGARISSGLGKPSCRKVR